MVDPYDVDGGRGVADMEDDAVGVVDELSNFDGEVFLLGDNGEPSRMFGECFDLFLKTCEPTVGGLWLVFFDFDVPSEVEGVLLGKWLEDDFIGQVLP